MAHQYICFSYSYKRPKCYTSQPKLTIPVYTTIYNYILWYITIFRTGALAACRTHSPRASASTYDTRCRSNYNIVRLVPLASMAPVKVTPGVVAARDVRCRTHTAEKFRTSAKDVNVVARGKRQAIYPTPGGDSSAKRLKIEIRKALGDQTLLDVDVHSAMRHFSSGHTTPTPQAPVN